MKKYSILNTFLITGLLLTISLLLIDISNKYILTQDFFDRNGEPLSGIPELEAVTLRNIRQAIYFYAAAYVIAKLLLVSLVIFMGLHWYRLRADYCDVFRIVSQCELLVLIPAIVKIWWFYYYVPEPTLQHWEDFYFLSAASLFDDIKPAYLYPLQTLNLFEIAYWFFLASGIKAVVSGSYDRSLRVVVFSYLPGLFLWMVVVVFFTMLLSPQTY